MEGVIVAPQSSAGGRYLALSTNCQVRLFLMFGSLLLLAPTPAWADGPAKAASERTDLPTMLFVFMLASFIGLGVILRVSRLLHTPLMSLTNAIASIAVVGSIIVTGADYPRGIRLLGAIALFASMTNIVSGFLITDRMLKMFREKGKQR